MDFLSVSGAVASSPLFSQPFTLQHLRDAFLLDDTMCGGLVLLALICFWCWIMSLLTRNYSQVDRIWSIEPPFFVLYFALAPYFVGRVESIPPRVLLMCVLACAWGIRLTYNYWRKGGYNWHEEDYRWSYVRKDMSPIAFQLLNITFIAVFQNVVLSWIAVPVYLSMLSSQTHITPADWVLTILFLICLVGETVADQQQWNFHQEKAKGKREGRLAAGFLYWGLFRYSRHPNFFFEQSLWWVFGGFAVVATGEWLNWALIGPTLYSLIFQGSTPLTERITLSKYPAYKYYQKTTSRIIPWLPSSDPLLSKQNK